MTDQDSPADGDERLQKVLARVGMGSRRQVEDLIREGRITVNGQLAALGQRVDLQRDAVKVDGKRIGDSVAERRYLLINKPAGCVSTLSDPEGRATVLDLLPPRLRKGLVPVGRLDYETEGLMILTNDGELAHHIAHPRYGCIKTYEAKVKGRPKDSDIERLRQGVVMFGRRTAPAFVASKTPPAGRRESVLNSWWTVKLGEGRTRQIREMFFRIGHPVNRLRRVAIGPLTDPRLSRGSWRELTEREVDLLRERTAKKVDRRKSIKRFSTGGKSIGVKRTGKPVGRSGKSVGRTDSSAGRPADTSKARPGGRTEERSARGSAPAGRSSQRRSSDGSVGGAGRTDRPKRGGPKQAGPARGGSAAGSPKRGGPKRGGPKSGGPSRGGPKRGGPSRGGPKSGGSARGPSRGGPSRGGPKRGGRG